MKTWGPAVTTMYQSPSGADLASETQRLLAASGTEKSFRKGWWRRRRLPVLRGTDLELGAGEVVGLVGENGSGKSTFMKILVGALVADEGTVTRLGRIGYCPQVPQVYGRLTCADHVELFGAAYGLSRDQAHASARDLYETLGFARFSDTRADELSGGTLAKLNLSLALLADPEVLLLDEPYAGFDFDTYLKFWDLVAARRAAGRSALIVSHFVVDEDRFDRIVQIRDGKAEPR